jgi:flavin reductase (DIM6/NTAB) family NADH-FMN oxidoreductase RutF
MKRKKGKEYYDECDMIMQYEKIVEAAKFPRTTVVAVVRDPHTGYLNAGPYSGGVISLEPFRIIFGVKDPESRQVYEEAGEFVASLPSRKQINEMYITSLHAPHGISEIDVAGLTELPSVNIECPGIKEFPINLECRTCKLIKLGGQLRNIVIADVVGISMDAGLLEMERSEAVNLVPIHEAIQRHPKTKRFGLSTLTGISYDGTWEKKPAYKKLPVRDGKVFLSKERFMDRETQNVFINAVFPRPNYIVNSCDDKGVVYSEAVTGGLIMHSKPAVQVIVKKGSQSYKNILSGEQFSVSAPTKGLHESFLKLRDMPGDAQAVGLHYIEGDQIKCPSIEECPSNLECKVFCVEEIPDSDIVLIVAEKAGLIVTENLIPDGNYMKLYTQYLYSVLDHGLAEKFSNHDMNCTSIRGLPTWGSRYFGGWWGNPEFYQSGFVYWLLELIESNYISVQEYALLKQWITWFRNEGWYCPEPLRTVTRERITTCLNIMCHAHRDEDEWDRLHAYMAPFLAEGEVECDR